ncbi:hypothetical protein BDL97_04G037400 [Sphagnum fallax]|nr:hypothetical protein BDL97_04G037400 [Sphagnum fallax]
MSEGTQYHHVQPLSSSILLSWGRKIANLQRCWRLDLVGKWRMMQLLKKRKVFLEAQVPFFCCS